MTKPSPLLEIHYSDPYEHFEGFLVIDTLVDGLAAGGFRITPTVDASEVRQLAAVMTLKNTLMGLPIGGAKSAIRYDPTSPHVRQAVTRFFEHVRPVCESMYGWGPDMNTPPELCDEVARRAGLKSRHMALAERSPYGYEGVEQYNRALRLRFGPLPLVDLRTAAGVVGATEEAADCFGLSRPLRVAVQGFGSVGAGTVYFLANRGHRVVGVADASGYYRDPEGLSFDELYAAKADGREIDPTALDPRLHAGPPATVFDEPCDVLVLAAVKHALDEAKAQDVRTAMVVQGGNLAVTHDAERVLERRGIPCIPDFLASAGGIAIVSGIIQLGWDGDDPEQILRRIEERTRQATRHTSRHAIEQQLSFREAAIQICSALGSQPA
jgi:glutamate dehydrogenase (NAD(P)+)